MSSTSAKANSPRQITPAHESTTSMLCGELCTSQAAVARLFGCLVATFDTGRPIAVLRSEDQDYLKVDLFKVDGRADLVKADTSRFSSVFIGGSDD